MGRLTLNDLDFDITNAEDMAGREHADALRDIRETREVLGKLTLRDSMEAVYGTEYTTKVLGEDGGNDILVEELTAIDDIRENNGIDRRDVGHNRLPLKKKSDVTEQDEADIKRALTEQEDYTHERAVEAAKDWYEKDSDSFRNQHGDTSEYPVDKDLIIKLLQDELKRERNKGEE